MRLRLPEVPHVVVVHYCGKVDPVVVEHGAEEAIAQVDNPGPEAG
jgi:hypothetical protein